MFGRRLIPALANHSKLLKPTTPLFSRVFSETPAENKEQGDPEVLEFIKKVKFPFIL